MHRTVAAPLSRLGPIALSALLAWSGTAAAEAARYELDPVHTRVMFAVSHAGFSNAIGTVSGSTGELWFDPEDWRSARLRASVPIARIDLGDAKWNKAALANNLLDGADHPVATFESTRIEPVDATHAKVHGTLTLHGVSGEAVLNVVLNAAKRHPMPPFRRTVGFSATGTISRKAFGVDGWPSLIGDAVEIRIEAEAERARGGMDDAPPTQAAPAQATDAQDDAPAGDPAAAAADATARAAEQAAEAAADAAADSTATEPDATP